MKNDCALQDSEHSFYLNVLDVHAQLQQIEKMSLDPKDDWKAIEDT